MSSILLKTPAPIAATGPATKAQLHVDREDIDFRNVTRDVVRLEVTVHNVGGVMSEQTTMQVNAAPFGAFVESTPVARIRVPRIRGGESWTAQAEFADPRARDAGVRTRLPESSQVVSRPGLLRRSWDLMRSLRQTAHWAGNFDVHVGSDSAERHCARAVRLIAGRLNIALFRVGHRQDQYRFSFRGEGAAWKPRLVQSLAAGRVLTGMLATVGTRDVLRTDAWHHWDDVNWAGVTVTPPRGTKEGLLAVAVKQRSTGTEALVEFGFGTDTIPPGCFRS